MEALIKNYTIYVGIKNNIGTFEEEEEEIPANNVQIPNDFKSAGFNSQVTIEYVKMAFCSSTLSKYNCCICMTSLYYKTERNSYHILSRDDKKKLSEFEHTKLYLVQTKNICNCEYKNYNHNKYLIKYRFEIIKELKQCTDRVFGLEKANNEYALALLKYEEQTKALIGDNKKKVDEIIKLKKEIERLKKIDELTYLNDVKYKDVYDITININSIKDLKEKGWDIKFAPKGEDNYKKYKNEELIKIGVIGNNNKGKSFLLSKISKIDLLTGSSINTQGLSIKYPDSKGGIGKNLILLDSFGLEKPILTKNDKKDNLKEFQDDIRDKMMTELFLENLIINISDILLVVVGQLTFSEQLLINKIKEECKKQNKGKIFIVHNLQEFFTKEQIEEYIENTLMKCSSFNLKRRTWMNDDNKAAIKEGNEEDLKGEGDKDKKEENQEDNIKEDDDVKKEGNEIGENKDEDKEHKENGDDEKKKGDEIPINVNNIHIHPPQPQIEKDENENIKDEIKDDKNHEKEQKQKSNGMVYTEIENFGDNKKLEIYHLIIANENSEPGLIYNQYAYEYIENYFNFSDTKKFDIFEKVKENFKLLSTSLLTNSQNYDFNSIEDILKNKNIILKLKEKKKEVIIEEKSGEKIEEKNEEKKEDIKEDFILNKNLKDEPGISSFKKGNLSLRYNYFKHEDNKTLEIRIEAPGNIKITEIAHNVIGDETIVTIKGEKKKDSKPKKPEDDLFDIREFGEFELNIPLKVQDFKIIRIKELEKDKKEEGKDKGEGENAQKKAKMVKSINGICCIQFELALNENEEENLYETENDEL